MDFADFAKHSLKLCPQVSDKTIEADNEFEDDKSGNKDNSKAAKAAEGETPMEVDGDSGGGGDKSKNETAAA